MLFLSNQSEQEANKLFCEQSVSAKRFTAGTIRPLAAILKKNKHPIQSLNRAPSVDSFMYDRGEFLESCCSGFSIESPSCLYSLHYVCMMTIQAQEKSCD